MYVWKLQPVFSAEGGVAGVIDKARRAKLSAIWVKIADGRSPYSNTTGPLAQQFHALVRQAKDNAIQVWGWQVPHCADKDIAAEEAKVTIDLAQRFNLDGVIMDAEGGPEYFHGGVAEATAYAEEMRRRCDKLELPLAISSNDIPQNIAGWLPKFTAIARHATYNFPQTYYGGSPSVVNRVDRAVAGNAHVTAPFVPVGAAWLGQNDGGCSSASACAERAREFIRLCKERGYEGYSFWHWAGAPMVFWDVLNSVDP